MTAFGYVRVSRVHDEARTISPETQRESIIALARANGDEDVTILRDLDISGRKTRDQRPRWDQLLTAVEEGRATAVYGYSLSRFARSVQQLLAFFELCRDRGVPVRMVRDAIDTSSATGRMTLTILAAVAQMEAEVASERVKDAFARKSESDPSWSGPGNVPYGSGPGEDLDAVRRAFEQSGSFDGAAKILNVSGVPTRQAGSVWHGSTVSGIMRRLEPRRFAERVPRGTRAGSGDFRLSRLLVCGQCSTVMTPSRDWRTGEPRYYCRNARVDGRHGRGWVSEKVVLPAIAAEAERTTRQLRRTRTVGSQAEDRRAAALEDKIVRVKDLAADGLLDKADARRRIGEVEAELRKLETRRTIRTATIPADIEADPPRRVNSYLRRIFDSITVESMRDPARRGPSREPIRLAFAGADEELTA